MLPFPLGLQPRESRGDPVHLGLGRYPGWRVSLFGSLVKLLGQQARSSFQRIVPKRGPPRRIGNSDSAAVRARVPVERFATAREVPMKSATRFSMRRRRRKIRLHRLQWTLRKCLPTNGAQCTRCERNDFALPAALIAMVIGDDLSRVQIRLPRPG